MRKIAILTYNHCALFELGCAVELFALPRPELDDWYECDIVSLDQGPHHSTAGLQILAKQVDSLEPYDMLLIPSWPTHVVQIQGEFAEQILKFHQQKKRIIATCSGSFLLGALSILDDRQATTHWRYANKFKQRFTNCDYVDDVLYVYDGEIGTSAGSAAAIDLGLEIIRQDYGQQIATQVARRLVVPAHRKGGQAQYVEAPIIDTSTPFTASLEWAVANLDESFSIQQLCERAHMSRRTFDRKFKQLHQKTAKQWLTEQRLDRAKELLEINTQSIEKIAEQSGFDNATTMRHHFRSLLGISPRQYRDQFSPL